VLAVTAYAMGTLYDKKERHFRELRRTYFGVLAILQQFISDDKYARSHCLRVAVYASAIATRMGFAEQRVDDVRAAALLHELGKVDASWEILQKAAGLTPLEMAEMRDPSLREASLLEPVNGSLRRIVPIVLAHYEQSGDSRCDSGNNTVPIESRILTLADAYDSLTSDRPYRRAITPFEAKDLIVKDFGADFDPEVVGAFIAAFNARQMELPEGLGLVECGIGANN
jgi:HD-GYP domain-containing protein (c-di-GMP phosphodiesterase class II)